MIGKLERRMVKGYSDFAMKKNISLTITINPEAYGRLVDIAQGYAMPTLMRMILEAASEHKGGLYTLLAKLATNDRRL